MSDWDFGPEVGDPLPTTSIQDRINALGVGELAAPEPMDDGPLWERYLIDRAEHEAHEWGALPDDMEEDDHSEPDA